MLQSTSIVRQVCHILLNCTSSILIVDVVFDVELGLIGIITTFRAIRSGCAMLSSVMGFS